MMDRETNNVSKNDEYQNYISLKQIYYEDRKVYIDAIRENIRSFDKSLLTLSAGAFVISLSFIRQIVPNIQNGTLILLWISWIAFIISILITLISFLTSEKALENRIDVLQSLISKDIESGNSVDMTKSYFAIATDWLNRISILSFIIGAVFLALFTLKNL